MTRESSPPEARASKLRAHIVRRVRFGELTKEQGEAEAMRAGIGPLAREPDKSRFDPMPEVWWSLAMTLAWIVWRRAEPVRFAWDDYRQEFWRWAGQFSLKESADSGSPDEALLPADYTTRIDLVPLSPVSALQVARWADRASPKSRPVIDGRRALKDLLDRLQEGKLVAAGIPPEGKGRVEILDAVWIDLTFKTHQSWPADAVGALKDDAPRYRSVRVRRAAVMALWPTFDPEAASVRTGAPGRPTTKHLMIEEAKLRLNNGWRGSLKELSKELADWFPSKHPTLPTMQPRSIGNVLSPLWRGHKNKIK